MSSMPTIYLDRDGHDIDADTWLELRSDPGYRLVRDESVLIGNVQWSVMTEWNGLRVVDRDDPATTTEYLFHTIVGGTRLSPRPALGRVWTFNSASLAAALTAHAEAVDHVRTGKLDWDTTDPMYRNPNIPMRYFMGVPA